MHIESQTHAHTAKQTQTHTHTHTHGTGTKLTDTHIVQAPNTHVEGTADTGVFM